jgi:hypothetical protein
VLNADDAVTPEMNASRDEVEGLNDCYRSQTAATDTVLQQSRCSSSATLAPDLGDRAK